MDSGKLSMVRLILDRGGDLTVKDNNGWTPLFRASGYIYSTRYISKLEHQTADYVVDARAQRCLSIEVLRFMCSFSFKKSNISVCQGAETPVIVELICRGSDVDVVDRAGLSLPAAARLLKNRL